MKETNLTETCSSCLGSYNVNYKVVGNKVLSTGDGCPCSEGWKNEVILGSPGEFEAGQNWNGNFVGNDCHKIKFDGKEMKFIR